jgi:DNA-binding GntR family transcriptional regulator
MSQQLPEAQRKDEAAASISNLILSAEARAGTLLRLAPLAERLDMSVTPVREALLILAQEGWVVQEPNRGFRVAPIRRNDVDDNVLVRQFLAGELAARAAQRLTLDELDELAAIDDELHDLPQAASDRIVALNQRFHGVVDAAADSPRLRFIRGASRLSLSKMADVEGWLEYTKISHTPLLEALGRRDAEAARAVGSDHYRGGAELVVRHWSKIGLWTDDDDADATRDSARPLRMLEARAL